MVEQLRSHAARTPDATAVVFLERGEREAGALTYGRLDLRARAVAAHLQARGCAGSPVLLAFPNGLEFIEAFFGCLYAGAYAVPAPEMKSTRGRSRTAAIEADAAPKAVLTATADVVDGAASEWVPPSLDPESIAFLQYTSGSTSAPRGTIVPHAALAANLRMVAQAFELKPEVIAVSWLPVHHDMGLIMGVVAPAQLGGTSVLMSPLSFLQNPLRWLRAISRYRAACSGAPSSGYDLCLRRLGGKPLDGLDLSAWRAAFCGAEPIRPDVLRRFAGALAPCGFRPEALLPAYGLAEATLLVSGARAGSRFRSLAGSAGREVACCGRPASDVLTVIADPDGGEPLPDGQIGEILVSAPSVAAGYWNRPQAAAAAFGAALAAHPGRQFLRTGDLGFLRDGELYVTGRLKDLIIIHGQNHHPEDIEHTVRVAHPSLADGASAAFSIDGPEGEVLIVVHEGAAGAGADVLRAVQAGIFEHHGIALGELVIIRRNTLPRTANGKVQRSRCREAYLQGTLVIREAARA